MNWIKEEDLNIKFFHTYLRERTRRNSLVGITTSAGRVDSVRGMKEEVKNFLETRNKDSYLDRPLIEGCMFNQSSLEEEKQLEKAFTMEEIKREIWDCDGDKYLGQDKFKFNFIRKCWSTFPGDILNFLTDFHGKSNLSKVVTPSFIELILKVDNPQLLGEYRLVTLVGNFYKIVAKLSSNMLKRVIGYLQV